MSRYFIVLETDADQARHPVVRKLQDLRALRLSACIFVVEYLQGVEILHDHLRASLLARDHILVHPLSTAKYCTSARVLDRWVSAGS